MNSPKDMSKNVLRNDNRARPIIGQTTCTVSLLCCNLDNAERTEFHSKYVPFVCTQTALPELRLPAREVQMYRIKVCMLPLGGGGGLQTAILPGLKPLRASRLYMYCPIFIFSFLFSYLRNQQKTYLPRKRQCHVALHRSPHGVLLSLKSAALAVGSNYARGPPEADIHILC